MAKKRKGSFPGTLTDVFFEMPCLTELSRTLPGQELRKKWFRSLDARHVAQGLQKFIAYNTDWFRFLGIQPFLEGFDRDACLRFRSTSYIGAIPLRAPDTGKQVGDFVVTPRFFSRDRYGDYIEILDLLGTELSPEFAGSVPLASGKIFRPPLYLEAAKFIASLETLVKKPWRKFNVAEFIQEEPMGQLDWSKYAEHSYRAENAIRYQVKRSVLSEQHKEYGEIRYVFDMCKAELSSPSTPGRTRELFKNRIKFLEERLYFQIPRPASQIRVRAADTPSVRECKIQANKFLNQNLVEGTAWRVDFNDVFEKLVQHIFLLVSKSIGGRFHSNPKIPAHSVNRYSWELHNLEPDAVIEKNVEYIAIDAKYKSHLYNKYESTELLKSDFRRDLHQVLGYSAFSESSKKTAVLCYPSSRVESKVTRFGYGIGEATVYVLLAGIPLSRQSVPVAVGEFTRVISSLLSGQNITS